MDFAGLGLDALLDDLLAALPEAQAGGDDGSIAQIMADLRGLLVNTIDLLKPMKGGAVAYLPPTQEAMGMGQTVFRGVSIYHTADTKGYSKKFQKMFETYNGFFEQMQQMAGPDQPQMTFTATYTPNVMQIEGVSIDQYQTQMQYPPEVMQEMGPMMPWMMMLGATGQTGYLATTDDHVIMTTNPDPALVKQALASIKQGGGLGTGGAIQKLRAQALPADPMAEFYLSVGGFVETANMFMAMMMGQPLPIQAPADLPPVAWAMSAQESGVVGRLYVPVAVIEFGKEAFEQGMAMMMGGGPGGPQGGAGRADGSGAGRSDGSGRRSGGPPPAPQ